MNVLIDASCLMKELTGIGVYVRDLLDTMIPGFPDIHFTIFMNAMKDPTPEFSWQTESNVSVVRKRIPGKILLELWKRNLPPDIRRLAKSQPNVFHSPNFLYQNIRKTPVVTTVHDLAFLKRKTYGSRYSGDYHRKTLSRNLARADHCIVVSEAVAKDLQEICQVEPSKITVIHHGMNSVFRREKDCSKVKQNLLDIGVISPYILCVGTVEPRKNMPLLVKAFSEISDEFPDLQLVFAGRLADGFPELDNAIKESGCSSKIRVCGYVSLEQLVTLYQGASSSVFPSWDEGFGFPPLEAAACGTPVFASDISVHREILGDAATFFEPDSVRALIECLGTGMRNEQQLKQNSEKGLERAGLYSWENTARKHIQVYRSVRK